MRPLRSQAHQKCSANLLAKSLICLNCMADVAQIRLDRRRDVPFTKGLMVQRISVHRHRTIRSCCTTTPLVAEKERERIALRTKEALAAANRQNLGDSEKERAKEEADAYPERVISKDDPY